MKPYLPPLSRFGRLTLLLCRCQAKSRVITWRLSCMHTPFYFQIPKTFTRFPGSHPSKAQHGQEVRRKQRIEINFLKPALDLYFFQAGALLDYRSIWRHLRKKMRWHRHRAGKAPADTCTQWLLTFCCFDFLSMKGSALSIPRSLEANLCSHSDKLIMQMFYCGTRL